jgi:hypothetical protein
MLLVIEGHHGLCDLVTASVAGLAVRLRIHRLFRFRGRFRLLVVHLMPGTQ